MLIFRKLYKRIREEDRGYMNWSLIVFEKQPLMYSSRVLGEKEKRQKAYEVERVTVQYQCFLQVDLWLIVFAHTWKTKLKKI